MECKHPKFLCQSCKKEISIKVTIEGVADPFQVDEDGLTDIERSLGDLKKPIPKEGII